MRFRVGVGYDVHRLVEGRRLVLGGVVIPYHRGLLGHSDADVLCHAIGDALLGAAALGDLGAHFPDDDPAYNGISSLDLLRTISQKLRDAGYHVANIDATVVAQAPKLAGFIETMRQNIAHAVGVDEGAVSIKATTTEGLGFAGRGDGMAAHAVVLLEEIVDRDE